MDEIRNKGKFIKNGCFAWAKSEHDAYCLYACDIPVSPTFLRQIPQRFFFFFESLSPSLSPSSWSSLMEVPAVSLVTLALASGKFYKIGNNNKTKLHINNYNANSTIRLTRWPRDRCERSQETENSIKKQQRIFTSLLMSKLCIVGCAVLVSEEGGEKLCVCCELGTATGVLLTGGCCFFLSESCRNEN